MTASDATLTPDPTSAADPFDPMGLSASRRLTPAEVRRHSRIVRHLRLIVPAAAAGLLATYAISASPAAVDAGFLNNFSQIDAESTDMKLDRPRYAGEDLRGLPFEISAKSAARDPNAPRFIELDNPEALRTVTKKDGTDAVTVTARAGQLDTDGKQVDLRENVRLSHSLGGAPIVFTTDAAQLDLNENTVTSNAGVTGEGDQGRVTADSVTVFQGEGRAVLEGNVKLRLEPKPKTDDDEPELR